MTLNFANIKQSEISLTGNGSNSRISVRTPEELKTDLMVKRLALQSLELSTKSIPRFIPVLATQASRDYIAGATTNTSNSGSAFTNLTDYFINIRAKDNSVCQTSFVYWTNINNTTIPYFPDARSIFYEPYYYCYDFTDFLEMVQHAINVGLLAITGLPVSTPATFVYDAESNTFNLSVSTAYETAYYFEFSPELQNVFGFATSQVNLGTFITFRLKWGPMLVDINGVDYVNISTKPKNSIFPFDLYVIQSDLPLTPVSFISSTDPVNSYVLQSPIVYMFRDKDLHIHSGNDIVLTNNNILERQKTFEQNTFGDPTCSFRLILRTKKYQEFIEWVLPVGEKLSFTLNTYRLF